MVGLLTMTGGASLAGAWVYKRLENKKLSRRAKDARPAWWQAPWQTVQETLRSGRQRLSRYPRPAAPLVADHSALAFTPHLDDPTAAIDYGLRTSALALGLATTGWLIFPPLQIIGLPLLVYMGIPSAHAAYDQLWVDGRPSRVLAETLALAVCLAGGYYWIGALGFWLYYGGQRWLAAQQDETAPCQGWLLPTTARLWQAGTTQAVPIATLRPGDQVMLHSGEQAPIDGLITEGVAWLRPQALSSVAFGLRKVVGDRIAATDLVLVGRICVQVLPIG